MSTNTLFTIEMTFPFNFRLSVPGIPNPFASGPLPVPQPPVEPLMDSRAGHPHKTSDPVSVQMNQTDIKSWPPAYHSQLHSSSSSTYTPSAQSRKRRWAPASAEPNPAQAISAASHGFFDTETIFKDMFQDANEDVVEDLPPSKRRKGVANTVISTAFSAALVGAAVGLTVYRMWRDKGKPDDQEPATPPPPYEEQWTEPTNVKMQSFASSSSLSSIQTPSRKPRTSTIQHKRQSISVRHRQRTVKKSRLSEVANPSHNQTLSTRVSNEEDDKDEMDWIGDKLAQLIEEGKRALGTEIVLASESPEDEMDDGSGDWVAEDDMFGSRFSGSAKRPRHCNSLSTSSASTPRRYVHQLHSKSEDINSSAFASSATPDTSFSYSHESDWSSPQLKESMERARAAYRQRQGL